LGEAAVSDDQKGFHEIEHTADWELEAWAPDLPGLLEQAARGMYKLAGARLQPGPRQSRSVELEADDPETLVVSFLSELLFLSEQERLIFDSFHLIIEGHRLSAHLEGAPIHSIEKEIKAVTWHNLKVSLGARGLSVRVVFDV
jgi:SHS2 domain-containing protein